MYLNNLTQNFVQHILTEYFKTTIFTASVITLLIL